MKEFAFGSRRLLAAVITSLMLVNVLRLPVRATPVTPASAARLDRADTTACPGSGSLLGTWNEASIYELVNRQHPSETTPSLEMAGRATLAALYANTFPEPLDAVLPQGYVSGGLLSRTYPYLLSNGASPADSGFWRGDSYVAYAFQYQNYAVGRYPLRVTAVNHEAALYAWGPGSFDTVERDTLSPFSSAALFAADLGHALLLLDSLHNDAYSPLNAASFYQTVYNGKTYLAHARDLLHWLVRPTTVRYSAVDAYSTNHILRYASAYVLLGKALAMAGDLSDGCAAIGIGATFLERALAFGSHCSETIYETYPEFRGSCAFDSNYQAVSIMYLNWLYMNMPKQGVRSTASGAMIRPQDVFRAAIRGMNAEFVDTQLDVNGSPRAPVNSWCYGSGRGFADGEISECHNVRITGIPCAAMGEPFDAISATTAFQEFGQLVNQTARGNTVAIRFADRVSRWYTTGFSPGVETNCTLDRNQPFYI